MNSLRMSLPLARKELLLMMKSAQFTGGAVGGEKLGLVQRLRFSHGQESPRMVVCPLSHVVQEQFSVGLDLASPPRPKEIEIGFAVNCLAV